MSAVSRVRCAHLCIFAASDPQPEAPRVHKGLISAYNSVKSTIVSTMTAALNNTAHAQYALVAVGHGTGGSLAVFTGATFRMTFFDKCVTVSSTLPTCPD